MQGNPESGIRNPGNFGEWNPESTALESRIRNSKIQPLMESVIDGCGIRNPRTWKPGSKTLLDYLTWGDSLLFVVLYHGESEVIYETQRGVFHQITKH